MTERDVDIGTDRQKRQKDKEIEKQKDKGRKKWKKGQRDIKTRVKRDRERLRDQVVESTEEREE